MPRIKLPIPKNIHFSTKVTLRIYDMNYGGHLGNDSVLSVIHEARVRFLRQINLEEKNFYGYSLLMADSAIVYRKESFYGDDLYIHVTVTEFYRCGFELFYLIINHDQQEVARVKTGLVCYDHKLKRLVRLPSQFVSTFT